MSGNPMLRGSVLTLATAAALGLAPAVVTAQERQAEHPMPGEIVAIDHDTGVVVVDTDPVPVTVHFPAEHVQDLQLGDTITVYLSFEKGAQP